jgi:RNA processing factor Prp31
MFDMTCEMPKALIKEGWQPYGSPYIDKDGCDCQAMVKYEEDYKKSLDDAPKAYDELLNNLVKLEKENLLLKETSKSCGNEWARQSKENETLRESNEAFEFRLSELAKESYKAINENQELKKQIALLSERAQPRDGALKTCLEKIEALQKENELMQSRIRELLKENFQESKKNQKLLHLITECSRCMPKASEL